MLSPRKNWNQLAIKLIVHFEERCASDGVIDHRERRPVHRSPKPPYEVEFSGATPYLVGGTWVETSRAVCPPGLRAVRSGKKQELRIAKTTKDPPPGIAWQNT
jgi:hypothetical protein